MGIAALARHHSEKGKQQVERTTRSDDMYGVVKSARIQDDYHLQRLAALQAAASANPEATEYKFYIFEACYVCSNMMALLLTLM